MVFLDMPYDDLREIMIRLLRFLSRTGTIPTIHTSPIPSTFKPFIKNLELTYLTRLLKHLYTNYPPQKKEKASLSITLVYHPQAPKPDLQVPLHHKVAVNTVFSPEFPIRATWRRGLTPATVAQCNKFGHFRGLNNIIFWGVITMFNHL